MVRISTIVVLILIERLRADSDQNKKKERAMQVRSLGTVEKDVPRAGLPAKDDSPIEEEVLESSDEIDGVEDTRLPRNSKHHLPVHFSNDSELNLSNELLDYRRSSLLSESAVLRRRVRSQAARRKRLLNQSIKSHLERMRNKDEDTKEKDSGEKEMEDQTTEKREEDSTKIFIDDEDAAMEDKI